MDWDRIRAKQFEASERLLTSTIDKATGTTQAERRAAVDRVAAMYACRCHHCRSATTSDWALPYAMWKAEQAAKRNEYARRIADVERAG